MCIHSVWNAYCSHSFVRTFCEFCKSILDDVTASFSFCDQSEILLNMLLEYTRVLCAEVINFGAVDFSYSPKSVLFLLTLKIYQKCVIKRFIQKRMDVTGSSVYQCVTFSCALIVMVHVSDSGEQCTNRSLFMIFVIRSDISLNVFKRFT